MKSAIASVCIAASLATGVPCLHAAKAIEVKPAATHHAAPRHEMHTEPTFAAHAAFRTPESDTKDCCLEKTAATTSTDPTVAPHGPSPVPPSYAAFRFWHEVQSGQPGNQHPPQHHRSYHSRTTCQRE